MTKTVWVSSKRAELWKKTLKRRSSSPDFRAASVIDNLQVNMGKDGRESEIEVDIKLVNGNPPYIDAVIFKNGREIGFLEPGERLEGEYFFTVDYIEYAIEVKKKR
jgi:hypothetical protein